MMILASDTSTKSLSVAVCDGEKVLSTATRQTGMTHSQTHMPMICEMLAQAGLDFADVDVYACTNGPGSYTGIRIGVASTKAMAYASGKSAVGVSTIETLAQPFKAVGRLVCPLIDARNRRAFSAVFLGDQIILDEGNYAFDEILEFIEGFAKTRKCASTVADTNTGTRTGESADAGADIRKDASSKVEANAGVDTNAVVVVNPGVVANSESDTEVYADTGYELIFCGDAADSYKNDEKTLNTLDALKNNALLSKYDFHQTDPDAVDVAKIAYKKVHEFFGTESEMKIKFNPMLLNAVYLSASNAERMSKKGKNK